MTKEQLWAKLEENGVFLQEREKTLLTLRFGLDGDEPKSLEETAEILGITRERVRQIESRILRRHRPCRRSRPIRDFYL